jgi:hypothetical protein
MATPKVLVFSVGLNFYDKIYDRCIASHQRYAQRQGYDYVLVNQPRWATVIESVWLKVPLLLAALKAGYDWVFFVDADCEVRAITPRVETLAVPGKSLYFGQGFSGNINSGVIIAQNTPEARAFFQEVFNATQREVPEMDWGENGHIIHFCKGNKNVQILDKRWNNNVDVNLDDYVHHYSGGGPMRTLYKLAPGKQALKFAMIIRNKLMKLAGGKHTVPRQELIARLEQRVRACQSIYPGFLIVGLKNGRCVSFL